jgi:hypothetical protein
VDPQSELLGCLREVAEVDQAEQCGFEQAATIGIETEVDDCIELTLTDRHIDGAIDTGDGGGEVGVEQSFGFGLGDGFAGGDGGVGVAVADGPDAGAVLVCSEAEPFEAASHLEAGVGVGEVVHWGAHLLAGAIGCGGGCIDSRYSHIQYGWLQRRRYTKLAKRHALRRRAQARAAA